MELAIVMGIIGLFSAIVGAASQSESNTNMRQMTRETNEQNYRIWQEQKQHNEDMYDKQHEDSLELYEKQKQDNIDFWNMENEYNSITAQMERAVAAGLSPMSVLNGAGTSAGNITSPNVSLPQMMQSLAPTMQSPPAESARSPLGVGFQSFIDTAMSMASSFDSVASATNTFEAVNKTREEAVALGLQNEFDKAFNPWKGELIRSQVGLNWLETDFAKNTMQGRVDAIHLANNAQRANILSMSLDNEVKQFNNQFLGVEKLTSLQQEYELLNNLRKQGNLTDAEIKNKLTQSYLNVAEANYLTALRKEVVARLPLVQSDVALQTALNNLQLSSLPTAENISKLSSAELEKVAEALGVEGVANPKAIAARYVDQMITFNAMQELYGASAMAQQLRTTSDHHVGLRDNWWMFGTEFIGNSLRNVAGGLLAPYDVNDGIKNYQEYKVNKNRRRIGFRP